ncbi:MAG: preprotein translocase subunit SecA [Salinivirgaceae bacterium]|jgi:preprotein translocase subunit SecA|nr:preprotein translocase subunit SecA [Salinivirgaceae bacterium]
MSIIDGLLTKFFGNKSDRDIKEINPFVGLTNEEFQKLSSISNDELRGKTKELQDKIKAYISEELDSIKALQDKLESENIEIDQREDIYIEIDSIESVIDDKIEEVLEQILPTAFAIVKETARRFKENDFIEVSANDFDRNIAAERESVEINGEKAKWYNSWIAGGTEIIWDMVHYDVQLIGGVALHKGRIAEMATGEGKTLVATLPVFLNALTNRGVHLVTVNDYLAKRDAEWMGPLYEFHGLSVDCIDKHQPNSEARRKAYKADITFGTNNEFGFDYLRDNMAISPDDLVQRRPNYSIVDEVDSVLIDDARTPLIISGPVPRGENQLFEELKPRIQKLYTAQRNFVTGILSECKKLFSEGKEEEASLLLLRANKGLPKNKAIIKYLSEPGMKVKMQKTENLYMQENSKNMFKVTDDLFFVIDEKQNSIELTEKGIDLISTEAEDSSFFVLPDIGAEIADLENKDLSSEDKIKQKDLMLQDYAVKSERVHTINQLLKAYAMFELDVEYVVMDNKVKIVDEQTGRIMEGRRYSDGLHQAIEAKENVKVEAATQTFATITLQNYFRMYSKLAGMTGTAETEAGEFWDIYKLDVVVIPTNRPITRDDQEDLVFKTTREKYNAVIEEVVKLVDANRPVLVGTTSVEVSELLSRMLKIRGIRHNVLNAKLHQREADIVAEAGNAKTVTIATNMAGRGTDIKLTDEVKAAGGLAIVGTERHESRRVDRQLRGRAGRQGDPGSSMFFISLEDNLMRLFGSDRIASLMDKMGLKDGEVIQHSMISKSIERAQKKVEENNFGIRKRLLEYDDVMNNQREVIYKRRKHALFGDRLKVDIANNMFDVCENLIDVFQAGSDYEGFKFECIRSMSIASPFSEDDFLNNSVDELSETLYKEVLKAYKRKSEHIQERVFPVVKNVFEKQGQTYENIVIPITDGQKTYNIVTNLKEAYESEGKDLVKSIEKSISLLTIDDSWKEHLREMDELKQSVQNATYEQKDPLLIYKFESFELFKVMVGKVNRDVVSILMKGNIPVQNADQVKQAEQRRRLDMSKYNTSRTDENAGGSDEQKKKVQPVRVEKKVGRNEPCPCGSGKKFKACHGKDA